MKFLCVPCNRAMKIRTVAPPDRGSLAVVYACTECGYEMAMLTNPYETQLVQSLGVRVGPAEGGAENAGTRRSGGASAAPGGHASSGGAPSTAGGSAEGSRCPFAGMLPSMEAPSTGTGSGSMDDAGAMGSAGFGPTGAAGGSTGGGSETSPRAAAHELSQEGAASGSAPGVRSPSAPAVIRWTPEAEARLLNIPAFVRPMARTGIERFALDRGWPEVDEKVLDEARDFFGM